MGIISLIAKLIESPPRACDYPTGVPSAVTTIPFTLLCNPKASNVSTGAKSRIVNSPGAFVALSGVGPSDDVTQANTIYARTTSGGFQLRVTYANPVGSPIVSILPMAGLVLLEPDAVGGYYATKLEVQGAGTIEYFASGTQ